VSLHGRKASTGGLVSARSTSPPRGGLALLAGAAAYQLSRTSPIALEGAVTGKYAALLVPVAPEIEVPAGRVVDVESIDVLARIAGKYERLIRHQVRNGRHAYLVADDGRWLPVPVHTRPPASARQNTSRPAGPATAGAGTATLHVVRPAPARPTTAGRSAAELAAAAGGVVPGCWRDWVCCRAKSMTSVATAARALKAVSQRVARGPIRPPSRKAMQTRAAVMPAAVRT